MRVIHTVAHECHNGFIWSTETRCPGCTECNNTSVKDQSVPTQCYLFMAQMRQVVIEFAVSLTSPQQSRKELATYPSTCHPSAEFRSNRFQFPEILI